MHKVKTKYLLPFDLVIEKRNRKERKLLAMPQNLGKKVEQELHNLPNANANNGLLADLPIPNWMDLT